jgi:SAM-dependent methyltransferase
VTFEHVNLLEVDLDKYKDFFDVIVSWGVIHHLSDPVKGLRNLTSCLKPQGLIYVWVYAKNSLGRIEGRIYREAINILLKEKGYNYPDGIKIVHAIKGLLKTQNYSGRRDILMRLKWFFDKEVNKKQVIKHILKNFRKIKYTTDYDANIVDSFLHANEKDYDIDMCFEEADAAGLKIVDFLDLPQEIETIVKSELVSNLYKDLEWRDRLKVMERLTDAGHHLFLARRK